jgi:hypothetical protein
MDVATAAVADTVDAASEISAAPRTSDTQNDQ